MSKINQYSASEKLAILHELEKGIRGCGHKVGLLKQLIQGFAGTPMDSFFQVMF